MSAVASGAPSPIGQHHLRWLHGLQGSTQGHWRFPSSGLEQGYVYLMTHPGTPCVFYDHLEEPRLAHTIQRLIALRLRAGVHCRSQVSSPSLCHAIRSRILLLLPAAFMPVSRYGMAPDAMTAGSYLGYGLGSH